MASRKLADLTARFRPGFYAFAAGALEAGVPLLLVQTLRSAEESAANIAKGTSWVSTPLASKHVDAYLRGWDQHGSDAADVVPYETYLLRGPDKLQWDTADPVWLKIRDCAQAAGLGWGVTQWRTVQGVRTLVQVDPGHVYWGGATFGPAHNTQRV